MKKFAKILAAAMAVCTFVACFAGCGKTNTDTGSTAGSSSSLPAASVKMVEVKLTDEQYAYAVNPADAELLKSVNDLLAEIKENGKFNEIVDKYFAGIGTPTGYDAGKQDSSKNQLVVATNTPFSPFEYKDGDKFYGVDIEIAALLADKLGKELVIVDMEFDAILNSVNSGNADIGMAGLTVSPDREKLVKFTEPYYEASQVVVCKADDATFDGCKTAEEVEAKIKAMPEDTKVGVQTGTTGMLYVEGDEDWGFDGFKVKCVGYESAASAVMDMLNGKLSFVVVDEAPAAKIVESVND